MTLTVRVPTESHAGVESEGVFHKGAAQSLSPVDAGKCIGVKGVFQEVDNADA